MGQEELGRLIALAREEANLSQPQLAERIGLKHPQSISNYERGVTEVPARRIRQIAEATGKPISFFLGEPPANPDDLQALRQDVEQLQVAVDEMLGLLHRFLPEADSKSS